MLGFGGAVVTDFSLLTIRNVTHPRQTFFLMLVKLTVVAVICGDDGNGVRCEPNNLPSRWFRQGERQDAHPKAGLFLSVDSSPFQNSLGEIDACFGKKITRVVPVIDSRRFLAYYSDSGRC